MKNSRTTQHYCDNYCYLPTKELNEQAIKAKNGDKKAEEKCVKGLTRLAVKAARLYTGVDESDLVQQSLLGILSAIAYYNPEKGNFASYASWHMRAQISRHIQDMRSTVRKPAHCAYNRERMKSKYSNAIHEFDGCELTEFIGGSYDPRDEMDTALDVKRITEKVPKNLKTLITKHTLELTLDQIADDQGLSKERVRQKVMEERRKAVYALAAQGIKNPF